MNILLILGHPDTNSFNHAIARKAFDTLIQNGHEVCFHDLHAEGFNPILPADEIPRDPELPAVIHQHCRELSEADGVIIVHPNWWGQPPAIVKGWVDRIFRPDLAYEFLEGDDGEGIPKGLLKAETAVVFNTSNTPTDREKSAFGDPLETLWKNCIFDFCGITRFYRRMFNIVCISSEEQRRSWLTEVEQLVIASFPKE